MFSAVSACCAFVSLVVMLLNMRRKPVLTVGANVESVGHDDLLVLICNGTGNPMSDVWLSYKKRRIRVAAVIQPGEAFSVLASGIGGYDRVKVKCDWRTVYGLRSHAALSIWKDRPSQGIRLSPAERELFGV